MVDGPVNALIVNYLHGIKEHSDKVIIIFGKENRGLAFCMNQIIKFSEQFNPQYFIRMDADDICLEDRFKLQISYLNKNSDIGVLGSSLIEINEEGKKVGSRILPEHNDILVQLFARRCPINHPTVVIRFELLVKYGAYEEALLNTQDYFLWIKLAKHGVKFANLREPLLKFRRVKDFYKRRGREKSINEFKARILAMKTLNLWSFYNVIYALGVFVLRMMPNIIIKLAYKYDRIIIRNKNKS
jgi:glycosyltransferase involved in cell wall biosynthesis